MIPRGNRHFGLIQLHGGKAQDLDPSLSKYHLDIIALHGLNGDAFGTWTNKSKQLWLEEFLLPSLPGARIYTFGYDSRVISRSKAGIRDFAVTLLCELDLQRQSEMVCNTNTSNF